MNFRQRVWPVTGVIALVILAACKSQSDHSGALQIIGTDNREAEQRQVFRRAVGKLVLDGKAYCTAFRTAPQEIMTAGHCATGRAADGMQFVTEEGTYPIEAVENIFSNSDIALLKTRGGSESWLELSTTVEAGLGLSLIGFDLETDSLMADHTGSIRESRYVGVIFHSFDTLPGASGSPVVDQKNRVIAVHLGATEDEGEPWNYGVLIGRQGTAEAYRLENERGEAVAPILVAVAKIVGQEVLRNAGERVFDVAMKAIERAIDRWLDTKVTEFLNFLLQRAQETIAKVLEGRAEDRPEHVGKELKERPDGRWCAGNLCAESDGRPVTYGERMSLAVTLSGHRAFEHVHKKPPTLQELQNVTLAIVRGGITYNVQRVLGYRDGRRYTASSCKTGDRHAGYAGSAVHGDRLSVCIEQIREYGTVTVRTGLGWEQTIDYLKKTRRWLDGGMYMNAGSQKVYFVFQNGAAVCQVQNTTQVDALGGHALINQVGQEVDLLAGRNYTGACGWPNVLVRRADKPEVWKLHGDEFYCHVKDEAMLGRLGGWSKVHVAPATSDLHRGRVSKGQCRD